MCTYRHHLYKAALLFLSALALMAVLIGVQAQNATACEPYAPTGWVPYTIRGGDTLSGLAFRHNVNVEQLQYLNCIRERSRIRIGQTIYVPGADTLLIEPAKFTVRCQEAGYEAQDCTRMMAMLGETNGKTLLTRCQDAGFEDNTCQWMNMYHEPANFALQCQEAGYDEQDCIRMMAMLGETNGNTLLTRCQAEGFDDDTCQWMMTMYMEEAGNGMLTRCREAGFDNETCFRMMLSPGQDDAEEILDRCFDDESDPVQCRWIMGNLNLLQGDQIRDRDRDRSQDQDCTQDCEPIQDQDRDRDQTRDQDCTEDCEPDQDQDRNRSQDQDCTQDCEPIQDRDRDGSGNGNGHKGGN